MGEDPARKLSPHVPCASSSFHTNASVAGVTSIDAGITGVASVVIGGAGVAGVAGGTGVPFLGVTLCAEVFSLVVNGRWCFRPVHTSCALAWLPFFFCSLVSCVA